VTRNSRPFYKSQNIEIQFYKLNIVFQKENINKIISRLCVFVKTPKLYTFLVFLFCVKDLVIFENAVDRGTMLLELLNINYTVDLMGDILLLFFKIQTSYI
jgi:hypothetical protein